jgi:hypothetical protein
LKQITLKTPEIGQECNEWKSEGDWKQITLKAPKIGQECNEWKSEGIETDHVENT